MKRLRVFVVFLICFTAGEGFCGGSQNRYVTFTDELISFVNDSGGNIYDLQYYLSVPIAGTIRDNGSVEIKDSEKGILEVFTPGEKRSLEVNFLKRYRLKFVYNATNKTYDLESAFDTTTKKAIDNLSPDPKPRLLVYYKSNGFFNVSAVTASQLPGDEPGSSNTGIDSQLTEQLNAAKNETSQLRDELQVTKAALQTTKTEADRLTAALETTKTETGQLTVALQTARTETGQLSEALQAAKTETGLLTEELKTAKTETERLTEELAKITVPAPGSTPPGGTGQPSDQKSTQATPSRNIVGEGILTPGVIAAYIRRTNPGARDVEALVDTYISEAKLEGINYDIAIAQMCYATDYLRNQQFINARNYAGFDVLNRVPVAYASMRDGVRAHIQHLKWYASGKLQGVNPNVDQRYNVLLANGYLGKAATIDDLFQYWAAPNRAQVYSAGINSILLGLYLSAGS